jgi:hypothetical protein
MRKTAPVAASLARVWSALWSLSVAGDDFVDGELGDAVKGHFLHTGPVKRLDLALTEGGLQGDLFADHEPDRGVGVRHVAGGQVQDHGRWRLFRPHRHELVAAANHLLSQDGGGVVDGVNLHWEVLGSGGVQPEAGGCSWPRACAHVRATYAKTPYTSVRTARPALW